MCLYFLFLVEKFFLFKSPWSKQALGFSHSPAWLSPKNPAADPAPGPGLQSPWSRRVSGNLIVLKHSSYRLIFQCPLSLVSDLHICWNTVGCSLCSSDQLGISLALRGSGLRSHLSRRHLPRTLYFFLIVYFKVEIKSKAMRLPVGRLVLLCKYHMTVWSQDL